MTSMKKTETIGDEQVLISLLVDARKVESILEDHKLGNIDMLTARQLINDLYEFNARQFQIKLNMEANEMMREQIDLTRKLGREQHEDLIDLINCFGKEERFK